MKDRNNNAYHIFSKVILENLNLNSTELEIFTDKTKPNLAAYQKNHIFTHLSALESGHPITIKALSYENFRYFGAKYVQEYPSTEANIDLYGEYFGDFLHNQIELEKTPMISYLAKIDWFLYSADSSKSLLLPKGALKLWENIMLDLSMEEFSIDETQVISIHLKIDNGETHLYEDD